MSTLPTCSREVLAGASSDLMRSLLPSIIDTVLTADVLIIVVAGCCQDGVFTRRIDKLLTALGIDSPSKAQISRDGRRP